MFVCFLVPKKVTYYMKCWFDNKFFVTFSSKLHIRKRKLFNRAPRTALTVFQKSNFHFRRLSNEFELSVKSSSLLFVTVWHKHTFHLKLVVKYKKCPRVSIENVIFQWVHKPRFGFTPFFLACLRCVRLLARNVTSVKSNMHSLMPYHIY